MNLLQETGRHVHKFKCKKCDGEGSSYYTFQKYCEDCANVHAGRTGNKRLRFRILERDGFKCRYCGRNPRDHDTVLHVDHIIPSSKGGTNEDDNLITACIDCNQGKANLMIEIQVI